MVAIDSKVNNVTMVKATMANTVKIIIKKMYMSLCVTVPLLVVLTFIAICEKSHSRGILKRLEPLAYILMLARLNIILFLQRHLVTDYKTIAVFV